MATPTLSAAQEEYMLAHTPGLQPPLGTAPNFANPYSCSYLIVNTTIVTLVFTTVIVALRTYTKRFINKNGLGWDDYFSVLAWIGYVCYASVGVQVVNYGGFVHQWNVPLVHVMKFLQIVNYIEILYSPVILLTKLSIVIQLLKIFAPTRSGTTYYACISLIVFNSLSYTAFMFVCIFGCSPRAKFWNPQLPGNCVDMHTVNISSSVVNMISDLVLLLLPIHCVWQLRMSARKKLGVSAVFATASFAVVCSVMRTVTSVQVVGEEDVTWGLLPEGLWALGEISSGIICGCMPTLPQFFCHFVPKMKSALSSSGRKQAEKWSNSSEQSAHVQKLSARYPKSPYSNTDSYVELGKSTADFKISEHPKEEARVWLDEVSVGDKQKSPTRAMAGSRLT